MDQQIYSVYLTILELLQDRGYHISEKYKINSLSDLEKKYKTRDNIEIIASRKKGDNILVSFFNNIKPLVKEINERIKLFKEYNISNAIFVVRNISNLSPQSYKSIEKADNITLFGEKELVFNVTKHVLVPKHKLLSADEKEDVLKKYRTTLEDIPKILNTDPVAKYYGYKIGDLIEITRVSETAGNYIHYRIVEKH